MDEFDLNLEVDLFPKHFDSSDMLVQVHLVLNKNLTRVAPLRIKSAICVFFSTHSFPGRFGVKQLQQKLKKDSACVIFFFQNLSPVGKKSNFEKLPGWGFQHVPPRVQVPQASRGDFWDHILRV